MPNTTPTEIGIDKAIMRIKDIFIYFPAFTYPFVSPFDMALLTCL